MIQPLINLLLKLMGKDTQLSRILRSSELLVAVVRAAGRDNVWTKTEIQQIGDAAKHLYDVVEGK